MVKYARLIYGRNRYNRNNQFANVGDCFQSMAVEYLYSLVGISTDGIVPVKREYLSECKEEVVLPMQGYFSTIKGLTDIYPIPDNIKTIYIGYHDIFTEPNILKEKIDCLRRNSPIGCRDEKTYQIMCKYGIPAYISGCLTIALPQREKTDKQKKVFLVDAPKYIEDYMPEYLKQNVEYITHEIEYDKTLSYEDNSKMIEKKAEELLARYREEAALVITSRLHGAGPCLGMGVPVILARDYFDDRYGWIDKYLPLYTPDRFSEIKWDVSAVDVSRERELLIELFINLLNNESIDDVSAKVHKLYIKRKREKLRTPLFPMVYKKMQAINARFADFAREKLLQSFTVATARNSTK